MFHNKLILIQPTSLINIALKLWKRLPNKDNARQARQWDYGEQCPPVSDEECEKGKNQPARHPEELNTHANDGRPFSPANFEHPSEDTLQDSYKMSELE